MRRLATRILALVSLVVALMVWMPDARADDGSAMAAFLRSCAWGTGIGAGVGALSLAFQDNPGEHTMNVARGASLGLYGGILYGVMKARQPVPVSDYGVLVPRLDQNGISGVDWAWTAASF